MSKRCNSNELLIRIDERVKVLPEIKKDIKELRIHQIKHHFRIKVLEKSGGGYNIFKLIRFIFGR